MGEPSSLQPSETYGNASFVLTMLLRPSTSICRCAGGLDFNAATSASNRIILRTWVCVG